jgi:hypothetical protein
MIKIKDLITTPSLEYHIKHGLSLYENVYRYSSDSFIQLFSEAREALRDGLIQLNEEDTQLLESTDIGEYGMYEGQKIPLDLPMIDEMDYDSLEDEIANNEFGMDYNQLGPNEKEWVRDEIANLNEAEYRGKDVALNKPKRGGSKKFVVYVKDPKSKNIKKVSFGGTTGLNVKIDEPGARASFAARHQCDKKKDKTKPGYWSCNIGRYWKSLGGSRNFSGYW